MSAAPTVGIHPRSGTERQVRLLAALGEAFPTVRFEGHDAGERNGLDALIEFGGQLEAMAAAADGIPALALHGSETSTAGKGQEVELSGSDHLDARLRGRTFADRHLGDCPALEPSSGAVILAQSDRDPLWTRQGLLDVAAIAPHELDATEALRTRLGADRWLALLPLLELLRRLTEPDAWQPAPLRAAFLLDDPNLHWPSYGFVKLSELARHGAEHGYHLAMAMVPLDAWFAHPAAARLLRESASLSLLVHGNDHLTRELGSSGDGQALALAAQAQRRVATFERRSGVEVSRVMAPPHEACSEAVARALPRAGFDAITMTRPYPWLSAPPRPWLLTPTDEDRLCGWRAAEMTPSNLPVLLRHPMSVAAHSPTEVAMRAYLNQPLILYGHHEDLADGTGLLAQRAAEVNGLGPVRWGSLGELAETNFEQRREGALLRIRPYSRRLRVEVPAGVSELVVEPPPHGRPAESLRTPEGTVPLGEPFAVSESTRLDLSLRASDRVSPASVPAPRRRAWPAARRIAAEARDRVAPARRRVALLKSS